MSMERNKILHSAIIAEISEEFEEVLNIPSEIIELIVLKYLKERFSHLKNGDIVKELEGTSSLIVRRTNSEKNGGYATKIITRLNPEVNEELCQQFATGNLDFLKFN